MKTQWHPEELALLAAIHAEPWDDTPRLVYADWLDEHDQPEYAEFVRLQCTVPVRSRPARARRDQAREEQGKEKALDPVTTRELRLQELEHGYGKLWASPIPRGVKLSRFSRGLPVVSTTLGGFRSPNPDRLLSQMSPRLRLLAEFFVSSGLPYDHPIFSRVDELTVHGDPGDGRFLRDIHLRKLAACPFIDRFSSVSLFAVFKEFKGLSDKLIGRRVPKLRYIVGVGAS